MRPPQCHTIIFDPKFTLLSQKGTSTYPPSNKITNTSLNFQTYSNQLPNTHLTTGSPRSTTKSQRTNGGKNSPTDRSQKSCKLTAPLKTGILNTGPTAHHCNSRLTSTDTNSERSTIIHLKTTKPSTQDTSGTYTKENIHRLRLQHARARSTPGSAPDRRQNPSPGASN